MEVAHVDKVELDEAFRTALCSCLERTLWSGMTSRFHFAPELHMSS